MSVGVEPGTWVLNGFPEGTLLCGHHWEPRLHQAAITESPLILCSSDFLKVSLLFFKISVYTHNKCKLHVLVILYFQIPGFLQLPL